MPAQLSTVMYIADYKEKTSGNGYIIGNAIGYTRLDSRSDQMQKFTITAFYPIDTDSKPCYLPTMKEEQVLSVSNSKFSQGTNGELEVSYFHFIKKITLLIIFYLLIYSISS